MAHYLHSAVLADDFYDVRNILMEEPSAVEAVDYAGNRAIHLAAARPGANPAILTLLLATAPATAFRANNRREAPTHVAARTGNLPQLVALAGAARETLACVDVDGCTPLLLATRAGHEGCVTYLLDAAPGTAALPDASGKLPVHAAVELYVGSLEHIASKGDPASSAVVEQLLERTAMDASARRELLCSPPRHPSQRTLLHVAAYWGHAGLVRLVLAIDPDAALLTCSAGNYPIHLAAAMGSVPVLRAFLDFNPNLARALNELLELPLHCAATSDCTEAVEVLLQAAPDTATALMTDGCSALYQAARRGNLGAVDVLLRHAPLLAEVPERNGFMPIYDAALFDEPEVVGRLLERAPHTAANRDGNGLNALHAAVRALSLSSTEVILRHAPDLAASTTADGKSCMRFVLDAFFYENLDDEVIASMLRPLLAAAPSLATMPLDEHGWLPIHWAARHCMPVCTRELLAVAPGTVMAKTTDGCVPLDLALCNVDVAREQQDKQAVRALVQAPGQDPEAVLRALVPHAWREEMCLAAITAHVPLSPACWELVPLEVPRMLHTISTIVENGRECDVEQAIARLTRLERDHLRSAIMSLHRAAKALPPDLVRQIVCMAF